MGMGVNMIKVSVIIPVYQVERYLRECLDSVIRQSLPEIEIICVNDGSKDSSGEILREYAQRDKRIVIVEKKNTGYGHSMNVGIAIAKGEYIGIVEPDDYIEPEMYESLYGLASTNGLDWIKGEYHFFIDHQGERLDTVKKMLWKNCKEQYGEVIDPREVPQLLIYDSYHWKGIYKRQFLEEKKILFNETPGAAYQDNGFFYQTFCLARRIMYVENPYYWYRKDNETASSFDSRGLDLLYKEYEFIRNFLRRHKEETQLFWKADYVRLYYQFLSQLIKVLNYEKLTGKVKESVERYRVWLQEGMGEEAFAQEEYLYKEVIYFIRYPEAYFLFQKSMDESNRELISVFLSNIRDKEVVLVGAGRRAQRIYCVLRRKWKGNIAAVCDNSQSRQGCVFNSMKISSVEEAVEKNRDASYIVTSAGYFGELRGQLLKLGITDNRILHFSYQLGEVECLIN